MNPAADHSAPAVLTRLNDAMNRHDLGAFVACFIFVASMIIDGIRSHPVSAGMSSAGMPTEALPYPKPER